MVASSFRASCIYNKKESQGEDAYTGTCAFDLHVCRHLLRALAASHLSCELPCVRKLLNSPSEPLDACNPAPFLFCRCFSDHLASVFHECEHLRIFSEQNAVFPCIVVYLLHWILLQIFRFVSISEVILCLINFRLCAWCAYALVGALSRVCSREGQKSV